MHWKIQLHFVFVSSIEWTEPEPETEWTDLQNWNVCKSYSAWRRLTTCCNLCMGRQRSNGWSRRCSPDSWSQTRPRSRLLSRRWPLNCLLTVGALLYFLPLFFWVLRHVSYETGGIELWRMSSLIRHEEGRYIRVVVFSDGRFFRRRIGLWLDSYIPDSTHPFLCLHFLKKKRPRPALLTRFS